MDPRPSTTNMASENHVDKRTRIVETAAKLVHQQGFSRTSLADIARESGVPLGNLYYYFKTKDAIGEALIEKMSVNRAILCTAWNAKADPRKRLEAFIQATIDSRDAVARSGCPIGSLCAELHKDGGPLAERAATLFDGLLKWAEEQFKEMGKETEARDLAFHLVSAIQGASLLSHTFHNTRQFTHECNRLKHWIRSL